MKINLDFETRSDVDIIKQGAYRYAVDPSTHAYMLAYSIDNAPVKVWLCEVDEPPEDLLLAIDRGAALWAFNAQFEYLIWNYVIVRDFDVPALPVNRFFCTAAQGRVSGLPGSLADQARCLGAPLAKQKDGSRLIRQYSCNNVPWEAIPATDQQLFIDYCIQDVQVEQLVGQATRQLTDEEWLDYHITEEINARGVPVDVEFAAAAVAMAETVKTEAAIHITALTGGAVLKPTSRKARDTWLRQRLAPEHLAFLENEDGKIVFDKQRRAGLLELDNLHDEVEAFTRSVDDAGGSTLTKYQTMLDSHINGRVHGVFMFTGGHTGRQSSRLLQLQNLRRDAFDTEEAETLMTDIIEGKPVDNTAGTLAKLVRPTIYSDKGLSVYDWSGIEARILAWLAGNTEELDLLVKGADMYKELASAIYKIPVDQVNSKQRFFGKIGVLSCGYSGGLKAIQGMAKNFGFKFTAQEALSIRDAYRSSHPKEVRLWQEISNAVMRATRTPGLVQTAANGKVSYEHDGRDLWLQLPSGRFMCYMDAAVELVDPPWDGEKVLAVTFKDGKQKPKQGETAWPRKTLGPNILVENICQAIGADLLRRALRLCQKENLPVIMSIHDEIVVEGDYSRQLQDIMLDAPDWAEGLPLAVDGYFGYAFKK